MFFFPTVLPPFVTLSITDVIQSFSSVVKERTHSKFDFWIVVVWLTKARILYKMERYPEALAHFNQALQLANDNVREHEYFTEVTLDRKEVLNELNDIIPKLEESMLSYSILPIFFFLTCVTKKRCVLL